MPLGDWLMPQGIIGVAATLSWRWEERTALRAAAPRLSSDHTRDWWPAPARPTITGMAIAE